MDFGGAAADPGVAEHVIPMGDRQVQGFANTAEDLHDLVDAAPTPLAGGVFDHRGFHADVLAGVGSGGGFAGHGSESDYVDVYVGEHPLDGLTVGDGPAVGNALLGPLDSHLQGAGEDAQCHGAAQKAVVVDQPLLPQGEPAAHLSEDLGLRNPDVVEVDVVLLGLGGDNPDPDGLEGDAGCGVVNDEHGDAAPLTLVRIGYGLNKEEIGRGGAGDEHLGAVENPIVAVTDGPGLHHAAGVGAGLGLGLAEGVIQIAVDGGIEVLLLLLRGARADHEHGHRGSGQVDDAAVHFLLQHQMAQGAHAAAAVLLRNKRSIDAGLLGDVVQPSPLVGGEGAEDTGHGLEDATGCAVFRFAFLGRMRQILRFEGNAFVADDLADGVFESVKLGRQTDIRGHVFSWEA